MPWRWREPLVLGVILAGPGRATGQQIRELGVQATGTFSDPALGAAGVYGAIRTPGRTRLSVSLSAGASNREVAYRGELLAHFLLSPDETRKPGFYLAGGIAGVGGPVDRGYLVLTVGLEQRPRRKSGWAVEAGVGGGARIVLGYRWRWFPGILAQ